MDKKDRAIVRRKLRNTKAALVTNKQTAASSIERAALTAQIAILKELKEELGL